MSGARWSPTEDELRWYLGAACGELAQAICELRPGVDGGGAVSGT